jgi:uncharacterized protein YndB with AHSA1/START domain
MTDIRHALLIRVSPEVVYCALTEPEGLAGWWTKDLDVAGGVGGVSTFRFGSGAFNRMRNTELSPDLRVEWVCVDGAREWIGTRVRFELDGREDGTRLLFEHDRWSEATVYMAECSFHWARYLDSLREYCEHGRGRPDEGARTDRSTPT